MKTMKQMKYKDSRGVEEIIDVGVDAKNVESNTFQLAAARANLVSGDNLPTIFGKLMKWFADLKNVAWTGSYNDLTDKPNLGGLTGTVSVAKGGTGATTAAQARTNLGIGAAATYNVANNDTTNNASYLSTAAVAYKHGTEIDKLNSNLTANVNTITGAWLGGNKISFDGTSFYATAANGVKKKLGNSEITMWMRCWEQTTDAHAASEQIITNTAKQFQYLKLKTLTLTGKRYDDGYGNKSQVPTGTLIITAGKGGTELFRSQLENRETNGDSGSGVRTTNFGDKLIAIANYASVYIELDLKIGYNLNTLDLDYVLV